MTDDAERQRRSRAHRAGDHGRCDPSRCKELRAARSAGPVQAAVQAVVDAGDYREADPRLAISLVATSLAEQFDRRPSAALARELRAVLAALGDAPDCRPGPLDELRARMASRLEAVSEDNARWRPGSNPR